MRRRLQSFSKHNAGNVAVTGAVLAPILLALVGGVIQLSLAFNAKSKVQDAADSAAIASVLEDKKAGKRTLDDELHRLDLLEDTKYKIDVNDGQAIVTAEVKVDSWLAKLKLVPNSVSVESIATAGQDGNVDIALALDYSGSMNSSSKYQRMAQAANTFLTNYDSLSDSVRVGLVPFSGEVLVAIDGRYLHATRSNSNMAGASYLACVQNRGYPNAISVSTPTFTEVDSQWPTTDYASLSGSNWASENPDSFGDPPPWSYEDPDNVVYTFTPEPDGSIRLRAEWVKPDGSTNGWTVFNTYSRRCTYEGAWRAGWCNDPAFLNSASIPSTESFASSQVTIDKTAEDLPPLCKRNFDNGLTVKPLTNDLSSLKSDITSMLPSGLTNIALALDISWHLLSDNEPWTEGAQKSNNQDILILLTDGVQTVRALGEGNEYSISSANKNIAQICEAMKLDKIQIFTIAYDLKDSFTRSLLKNCASSPDHFYEPGLNDNLDKVFVSIASSVTSDVRLVK